MGGVDHVPACHGTDPTVHVQTVTKYFTKNIQIRQAWPDEQYFLLIPKASNPK
jgi:hypothetical protein